MLLMKKKKKETFWASGFRGDKTEQPTDGSNWHPTNGAVVGQLPQWTVRQPLAIHWHRLASNSRPGVYMFLEKKQEMSASHLGVPPAPGKVFFGRK